MTGTQLEEQTPLAAATSRRVPWRVLVGLVTVFTLLLVAAASPFLIVHYRIGHARECLRRRDYEGAVTWLRAADRLQPRRGDVYVLLARAYRHLDRPSEFVEYFNDAQRFGAGDVVTEREWQRMSAQQGRMGEVQPYLGKMLAVEGDELRESAEALARGFGLQMRFSDAVRMTEIWEKADPGSPWPWIQRGDLQRAWHQWERAAESYLRALEIASDVARARVGLAYVRMRQSQWDEAQTLWEACLDDPRCGHEARKGLVRCCLELKQIDRAKALVDSQEASQHETPLRNDPEWNVLRAQVALEAGRVEVAERIVASVLQDWPEDARALEVYRRVLAQQGKDQEAREVAQRLEPIRETLSKIDERIHNADEQPFDADIRYHIGDDLLRYQSRSEGLAWLQAAVLLNTVMDKAYAQMIDAYRKLGDEQEVERLTRERESAAIIGPG